MTTFTATLQRFAEMGEKTGWTYILIPEEVAGQIAPGIRKSFRVKGLLDNHPVKQVALMPAGDGAFFMAINASMRKGIGKPVGEKITVALAIDKQELEPPAALLEALADLPEAAAHYESLSRAERNYFTRWIDEAKGEETKARRIAHTVNAMLSGLQFGPMIRQIKAETALLRGRA
jgi:hypothetical protein